MNKFNKIGHQYYMQPLGDVQSEAGVDVGSSIFADEENAENLLNDEADTVQ